MDRCHSDARAHRKSHLAVNSRYVQERELTCTKLIGDLYQIAQLKLCRSFPLYACTNYYLHPLKFNTTSATACKMVRDIYIFLLFIIQPSPKPREQPRLFFVDWFRAGWLSSIYSLGGHTAVAPTNRRRRSTHRQSTRWNFHRNTQNSKLSCLVHKEQAHLYRKR